MFELASQMVIGPTKKINNERKEMVAFQKGILCSIQAVRSQWEELQEEGFRFLITHILNQDIIENLFSAIQGMGGTDTNLDPVTFCNWIRILKIQENYDLIKLLTAGTKTLVEFSPVDEIFQEPFIASEIGIEDELPFDHFISFFI